MRSVSLLRRVMRDLHLYVDTSELRDEAQEGVQREEYGVAAGLDSKSKLVQAIIRSAIGNVKDKEQKLQESQQRRKRAASSAASRSSAPSSSAASAASGALLRRKTTTDRKV